MGLMRTIVRLMVWTTARRYPIGTKKTRHSEGMRAIMCVCVCVYMCVGIYTYVYILYPEPRSPNPKARTPKPEARLLLKQSAILIVR